MKTLFLSAAVFIITLASYGQSSVVSGGGDGTGAGGSVAFSVGQVGYTNQQVIAGAINEGVQQPYELFIFSEYKVPDHAVDISIYPNPTTSFVNLCINNMGDGKFHYQLVDFSGQELLASPVELDVTGIVLPEIPAAGYLLNVFLMDRLIQSFKIIKLN